jgi:hypothetical protein
MIKKPPIAFAGHKGAWADYIAQKAKNLPEGAKVIDAFGGSGLCARAVIEARPDLRVVWNDFDGYLIRLDHAQETEILRQTLQSICGERKKNHVVHARSRDVDPLTPEQKDAVKNALRRHALNFGYVDDYLAASYLHRHSGFERRGALDPNRKWVNHIAHSPVRVDLAREHARILRPACACFDIAAHEPTDAYYILDPPYERTNNNYYKGKDAVGVFPAIERICRKARGVMLFCASHELEKFAPLVPDGELELAKRGNAFMGHSVFEACLCNW